MPDLSELQQRERELFELLRTAQRDATRADTLLGCARAAHAEAVAALQRAERTAR